MRYVIYGAGAIGASIGSCLHSLGRDVVFIARGAHLAAINNNGLLVRSPDGDSTVRIPAVGTPADAGIAEGNVILLGMKTQDTAAAVQALRNVSPVETPVFCAQNAVENERLALRLFRNVYGMYVDIPAEHLEPGVIEIKFAAPHGVVDLGRYPAGTDDLAATVAADLNNAGFSSAAVAEVRRSKYGKLVTGLGNAVKAVSSVGPGYDDIVARAQREALRCLAAAGIDYAAEKELAERRRQAMPGHPGPKVAPGSGWQSLKRGTGAIETDYINGEIVLLGRLYGLATPVNETIQSIATRMARERRPAGSLALGDLGAAIAAAELSLAS
jgi:2-dehydropantoate 2-reductase